MYDIIASIDLADADPDAVFESLQRWLSERGAGFRIAPDRTLVFETPFLVSAWMPASKVSGGELSVVASGRSTRVIYRLSLRTLRIGLLATFALLGPVWTFGLREMGGGTAAVLLGAILVALLGSVLYFLNRAWFSGLFARQVRMGLARAHTRDDSDEAP